MSNIDGYALDWDSQIEKDSPDFIVLPDGDYPFEVISLERGRHGGSEKLPECNKAMLQIKITGDLGTTTVRHNLFLHSKTEGLLCEFFTCIGARKKGERVAMDWDGVMWAKGRAKVATRTWKKANGDEGQGNEIVKFLPPDESAAAPKPYQTGTF